MKKKKKSQKATFKFLRAEKQFLSFFFYPLETIFIQVLQMKDDKGFVLDKKKSKGFYASLPQNLSPPALVQKCKILFQRIQGYPFEFLWITLKSDYLQVVREIYVSREEKRYKILNSLLYMRQSEDGGTHTEGVYFLFSMKRKTHLHMYETMRFVREKKT